MQLAMAGTDTKPNNINSNQSSTSSGFNNLGFKDIEVVKQVNHSYNNDFGTANSVGASNHRSSYSSQHLGSQSVGGPIARKSTRKGQRIKGSRRNRQNIVAPPGKLGIILANKFDTKGTVISGVRSSSVLADQIFPGDRIVAIDGEDVSRMTVSEITTIMARKNEFERVLAVLTTPKGSTTASPQSRSDQVEYVGGMSDNGSLVSNTLNSSYSHYRH